MCQNRKNASVLFDNMVLYPNSFMTITSKEYTKHYYMNGERLASSIGGGGLCAMSPDVISNAETHHEEYLFNTLDIYKNAYPYEYPEEEMPQLTQNVDIHDIFYNDLQYLCPMRRLQQIELKCDPDILYAVIDGNCDIHNAEIDVFYRHSDHLSSANWITDVNGYAIQYIHYLPYGQVLKNQMAGSYDERYKFTGKERDEESGYDYFGARYYASGNLSWLSVDPLADKYPNISPYAYAAWNPIRFIDPDGREITITGEDGETITYVPGGKYEGNDSFTKNTYTRLNQLNDMFSNTDFMSSIVNSSDVYNISSETPIEGTHCFKDGVLYMGKDYSIDDIGHELFHAYQDTKGQGGASIHNEVEAYLFEAKIVYMVNNGSGSVPLTAAEIQSSSTFSNALNTLIFDGFNQNAFNAVVSEFKTASNANAGGLYNNYPLVRSNQTQSLIKQFYPIYL